MSAERILVQMERERIELWVEGDRLRYRAPKGALTPALRDALTSEKAALMELLRARAAAPAGASLPRIVPDPARRYEPFPLTDMQQAYWIGRSSELELGEVGCHFYMEFESAELDIARLEQAWQQLVERHDMLRMTVLPSGQQRALEQVPPYRIELEDLRGRPDDEAARRLEEVRREMAGQVFPPERWPLFHIRATRLGDHCVRLHLGMDLLVLDAMSVFLLLREWSRLYQDPAAQLPPIELSFRDYVLAERLLRDSEPYRRAHAYWLSRLDMLPAAPELPQRVQASGSGAPEFVRLQGGLDAGAWGRLKERAADAGLTPTTVLLTAFSDVLTVWSRHRRCTLTLTTFNRLPLHPQVSELIGEFTGTVLLAVDHRAGDGFAARAERLQRQLGEDLEHSMVSGVQVLRELARVRGETTLMPVVFTSLLAQTSRGDQGLSDGWLGRVVYSVSQTPQVWLDHQVFEEDGALIFNWDVVLGRFPPGLIEDVFDAYQGHLKGLSDGEQAWVAPIHALVPRAQIEIRATVNATGAPVPDGLLHTAFEAQAARSPGRLAVTAPGRRLTYGELRSRATRVGRRLRRMGAAPNTLVAVVMHKGWEQIVAVLGVLAAGAAYLPLSPSLPEERLRHLLDHGQVHLVLTNAAAVERIAWPEAVTTLLIDRDAEWELEVDTPLTPAQRPEDLAYVIYTSGSTGLPKGVMIDHRGALNTIADIHERFEVGPTDRCLALSSLGFDLSVYDVFGTLAAGGTVVIPSAALERDPSHWMALLADERVTIWNSVPALMQLLLDHTEERGEALPDTLRLALLSGDWIPVALPDRLRRQARGVRCVSLGGATEASIWSILYPIEQVDPSWQSIPYGRPMRNQRFYVLDEALEHCPTWVPGQLYIAGVGLALGYWRDEEKTLERFFEHPRTGERLYRTGDLGRCLPDGNIELLGREDFQVKIQGHRIELGEIETALEQHPGVGKAVVTAVGERHGRKRLVAYVIADREAGAEILEDPGDPERAELSFCAAVEAGRAEARKAPPGASLEELTDFTQRLDDVYIAAVCRAFAELDIFTRAGEVNAVEEILRHVGIEPRYAQWLRRALGALADRGLLERRGERFASAQPLPAPRPGQTGAELLADPGNPMGFSRDELALFFVGAADCLAGVLRGEVHPAQFYVSEHTPAIYQKGFHHVNAIAAEVARGLVDAWPEGRPLRVLEIGAGFGSTTAYLLPRLPPERTTYLYTDISSYFTASARKHAAEHPFVRFSLLDIERDPRAQGYELHSFDLVVAASVLHATRDVRMALDHSRALLRPGGLLLLVEETKFHRSFDLSMGLQQGFDRFEDTALRRLHPLLEATEWRRVALEQGFEDFIALADAGSVPSLLGFDVLLARGPTAIRRLRKETLRAHLERKLPDYMVPAEYVLLDALPLTSNGKVDRNGLPALDTEQAGLKGSFAPPRDDIEKMIHAIWAEVLGAEQLGVHDNFFEIGGDSLLATRLTARMRDALQVSLSLHDFFRTPTVAGVAAVLRRDPAQRALVEAPLEATTETRRIVARRQPQAPLSFAQERLWFLDRLEPGNAFYNHTLALRIEGPLDAAALEQSLQEILRCHDVLRARFIVVDGKPLQVADPPRPVSLPVMDLGHLPPAEREPTARRLVNESSRRPFDLASGPIFRACLLRLTEIDHVLALDVHHIGWDGWSMEVLLRELDALYRDACAGRPPSLPDLPVQVADHAAWQREHLRGPVLERQLTYWRSALRGAPTHLDLPADRPRPDALSFRGAWRPFALPRATTEALRRLGHDHGCTLFTVLLGAFATLLYRFSGQDDILIGSPVANRDRVEIEGLIGLFANTLVLRMQLAGDPPFTELLVRARDAVLGAQAHQDLPFERLVEELAPQRDLAQTPLFQVMFALQQGQAREVPLGELRASFVPVESGTAKCDLALSLWPLDEGLYGIMEYSVDLFETGTIERTLDSLRVLLEGVAASPSRRLSELPILSDQERRRMVDAWNDTRAEIPPDACLHRLFEAQAARTPDAAAVLLGAERLTYAELERRANQVANHLQRLGVGPDALVAICLERSFEMIAGTLGVLKAGGAYVPLDPTFPERRLALMLEASGASVLLSRGHLAQAIAPAGAAVIRLDMDAHAIAHAPATPVESGVTPDNLAYVIFTSGSSGRPKGVLIEHRSAHNAIVEQIRAPAAAPGDRVLQLHSFSFDVALSEIFLAVGSGAALVLGTPDELLPGPSLLRFMRDQRVTIGSFPTAALGALPPDELPELRVVRTGGDICLPEVVERWAPGRRFFNYYGPTETAICSSFALCAPGTGKPTIGLPIANTRLYVLDARLCPVPIGVAGELYIGGRGVGRGYLGDPALTAERFLPDPFSPEPGARMYRTLDLVRRRPDGQLDFLGRADRQIKLRGYRIELEEIEQALAPHPSLQQVLVILREDRPGDKRLVAYLVAKQGLPPPPLDDLHALLRERLPQYMVPSAFMVLSALPLLPNGKIDRRALPAPEDSGTVVSRAFTAPRTPTEAGLARIWAELLGLDRAGIHDSFFDLGGHSLLTTRLLLSVRETFGVELPLRRVFEQPTIAGLAEAIDVLRSGPLSEVGALVPRTDLRAEIRLDPEIRPALGERLDAHSPVLLTGATGFLGAYLLREILRATRSEVRCLVRAATPADGYKRLQNTLAAYGLWEDRLAARIVPVLGDLSQPLFGLAQAQFETLSERVGAIYHNGAAVDFLAPYAHLAPANVGGTHEVLRLAARGSRKPVHYISTLAVFDPIRTSSVIRERDSIDPGDHLYGGYAQSKWVAEKLVACAASRGMPVVVYRPGMVSGDSRSGACNPDDFLYRLIVGCARLGCIPDMDLPLYLTPVDYVARAAVHLSLDRDSLGQAFHLVSSRPLHLGQLAAWMRARGRSVDTVAYEPWRAQLRAAVARGENNPIGPLLPFFPEALPPGLTLATFGCEQTQARLAGLDIRCPDPDDTLLSTYFSWLADRDILR